MVGRIVLGVILMLFMGACLGADKKDEKKKTDGDIKVDKKDDDKEGTEGKSKVLMSSTVNLMKTAKKANERVKAIQTLTELELKGDDKTIAAGEVALMMLDRFSTVREAAQAAYEKMDPDIAELLIVAINGKTIEQRRGAMVALREQKKKARSAVPVLLRITYTKQIQTAMAHSDAACAAQSIHHLSPDAEDMDKHLLAWITGKDGWLAMVACNHAADYENLKDQQKIIAAMTTTGLKHSEVGVRKFAAIGLGRFGKDAKSAEAALKKVARLDASEEVKAAAKEALEKISGKE